MGPDASSMGQEVLGPGRRPSNDLEDSSRGERKSKTVRIDSIYPRAMVATTAALDIVFQRDSDEPLASVATACATPTGPGCKSAEDLLRVPVGPVMVSALYIRMYLDYLPTLMDARRLASFPDYSRGSSCLCR